MARTKVIPLVGQSANTALIAALQAQTAGTPLTLTSSPYTQASPPQFEVTLTSASNLSAGNFVITGFDLWNNPVVETIAGPNNNTVQSVTVFSKVSSIVPSATSANTVSAGVPARTVSQWVLLNNYANYDQPSIANVVADTLVGATTWAIELTSVAGNSQGLAPGGNNATYQNVGMPVDQRISPAAIQAPVTTPVNVQGGQFLRVVLTSGAGTSGTVRIVRPHF